MEKGNNSRFKERFPPWCWSKGYLKYGTVIFIMGVITDSAKMYMAIIFGVMAIPFILLGFILIFQTIRPQLMMKARPCKDCPLTRGEIDVKK